MQWFYNIVKILYKTLPKPITREVARLRKPVMKLFYSGQQNFCNVCSTHLRHFVKTQCGESVCPVCGSLPRQRRLVTLVGSLADKHHFSKVLHFSPLPELSVRFRHTFQHYFSSDFSDEFPADLKLDIRNITADDNSFDLIICYHVLEHIDDDRRAMHELYRVTAPGGLTLVQTPFKEGDTYENPAIVSPQDRLEHFGQEDHVRIYGVTDLTKRLSEAGFVVEVQRFDELDDPKLGLKAGEIVLICKKPKL